MEALTAPVIDALGKLSVEVVSIVTLVAIIRWVSQSNVMLSKSHQILADSHSRLAESHEKLAESIKKVVQAVNDDSKITKELVKNIKKARCIIKK